MTRQAWSVALLVIGVLAVVGIALGQYQQGRDMRDVAKAAAWIVVIGYFLFLNRRR
jgi:hypothetical protein